MPYEHYTTGARLLTPEKPCVTFRLKMITGFNTDVHHDGRLYHVQTEDRGLEHPILESLVYMGGTVVAKKSTPYSEEIDQGATEEIIASLLKRQHQVIIAAIKAGRIDELIHNLGGKRSPQEAAPGPVPRPAAPERKPPPREASRTITPAPNPASFAQGIERPTPVSRTSATSKGAASGSSQSPESIAASGSQGPATSGKIGLDLDEVISDYLKRSSEQGKLDLKVISPNVFIEGKAVALKV